MINRLMLWMALSAVVACSSNQQSLYLPDNTQSAMEGYELVWHDEFNEGTKPDTSDWSYEHGFVRNEELQWYQSVNARIEEGRLIIEGRREQVKNEFYDSTSTNWKRSRPFAQYTSSSINTRGNQAFQYGIVEVRARLDTANGMWPAIWMLGTHPDRGWPANGEIDIMEYYRIEGEPHILANAAWADEDGSSIWDDEKIPFRDFLEKDPEWPNKYHTWKMNWNEDRVKLYLDDQLLNEINLNETLNPDGFNPFHQPHYILLNLAIGSNGGDPTNTRFPKQYEVDYVRVYQKKQ